MLTSEEIASTLTKLISVLQEQNRRILAIEKAVSLNTFCPACGSLPVRSGTMGPGICENKSCPRYLKQTFPGTEKLVSKITESRTRIAAIIDQLVNENLH